MGVGIAAKGARTLRTRLQVSAFVAFPHGSVYRLAQHHLVNALKGEVEWQYQREEAGKVVRQLWGVKGVSNLIDVKPRSTPGELKKKIEQALIRNAEIDANSITVEVQGSKAVLKGKVRSWAEKHEAEQAAWLAPGITSVENKIEISI